MTTRYVHVVSVKGVPQFAFSSRWGAWAWADAVKEDNGYTAKEISVRRLRIVTSQEMPKTMGCALL